MSALRITSAQRVHALQELMRRAPHLSMGQCAFIIDQAADLLGDWPGAARDVLGIVLDTDGVATVEAALRGEH